MPPTVPPTTAQTFDQASHPMRFGLFMAPFHRAGEHPTLALQRDLELVEVLDRLGYDEVWVGEHHSGGRELIADPAVFIAAAAERTKQIRLGTGVASLPYHHPFMVADKMVLLDHLTRGRAMLGVGPGILASDAYMLGIEAPEQRRMMNESLEVILRLLRGETVTAQTDWFTLREAHLQLPNYTRPHLPVSVAASFTPSGPVAAGRYGIGLLSVAGASHEAFERTWGWVEEEAAQSGASVSRADWSVVLTMHLAESREQAIADVERGFEVRAYAGDAGAPNSGQSFGVTGKTIHEAMEGNPGLIFGTPDDAIAALDAVVERSGGIGGVLFIHHEWASVAATHRSFELFQRYVAPRYRAGDGAHLSQTREWFDTRGRSAFASAGEAQARAFTDAGKAIPADLAERMRVMAERRAARAAEQKG